MKALAAVLTAAVIGTALWVWRGERWALGAFEEGIRAVTRDGADTWEEGMEMARSAGSGTEWVFRGVNP